MGFKGFFGVDGRYDNPAVQYQQRKNGDIALSKRPNVIFVSAHVNDNRLAYYSNYGKSVDIAAPSAYKSTKNDTISVGLPWFNFDEYYTSDEYGTNTSSGSFKGTSSATPVVTGVASLILAVDESLSPSEVKSILINSATNFVTERYIVRGNADTSFFGDDDPGSNQNIETLADPIPILNAANALKMVQELKAGKEITTEHKFPDPFKSNVTFTLSSEDNNVTLNSFDYVASVKTNGTYEEFMSGALTNSDPLIIPNLSWENSDYKITGSNAKLTHDDSGISFTKSFSYEFVVPKITVLCSDKVTLARILNVTLNIKSEDGSLPLSSGTTDANGSSRLFLKQGKYTIVAKADGYKDLTKDINVLNTDLELDLVLEPKSTTSNPNPPNVNAVILAPITPLIFSETSSITDSPNTPDVKIVEESGFDGDIDQHLLLREGIASITAVDIQRDVGLSVICEDGINTAISLNSADYSTTIRTDTLYGTDQEVYSCDSSYESILPVEITNLNRKLILADWGTGNTSDCPIDPNVGISVPEIDTSVCTSIVLKNYLITDDTGKQHKISIRTTGTPI